MTGRETPSVWTEAISDTEFLSEPDKWVDFVVRGHTVVVINTSTGLPFARIEPILVHPDVLDGITRGVPSLDDHS